MIDLDKEFTKKLEKYAEVIVKVGLNLQPGQRLLIGCPIFGVYGVPLELAPLIRLVTEKAYKAGARLVDVIWNDDQLRLTRFKHAPRNSFEEFPEWRTDATLKTVEEGDAILIVYAEDPSLLQGQDSELIDIFVQTNMKFFSPTMQLMKSNATNWCFITAPVEGWPEMILPETPPEKQMAEFWDCIFRMCRINESDPVNAWKRHKNKLAARSEYLNRMQFEALRFHSPETDLTIGLPEGHIWESACMTSRQGIDFIANLPTEEIFTLPHKNKTEGYVTTTKPLILGGNLINNIRFTFKEGNVVDVTAAEGEKSIKNLLETDEGASRLGEVALVPHSSPISQLDLLFNNILIDENASDHLALGMGFKFNLKNGVAMSSEEFAAAGGNNSLIHVDFMIGSKYMEVTGLGKDGSSVTIMQNGEWAFEI